MSRLHVLALLVPLIVGSAARADDLKSGTFSPARMAPAFTLEGSNGKPLKLSDYRGKIVVLGFGYTHCTAVCPVTLANFAQAFRKLGKDASQVQLIYVTVDPERDTPQRLHEYLHYFSDAFLGATGKPDVLKQLRQDYGISAHKIPSKDSSNYVMGHSSFVYLIDRQGKIRALVPFGMKPVDIAHDLEILVKQG